ncbi:hypothetical protein MBLNU459_g6772t1 [Dothideomycetes sp. NU459]
MYYYSTASFNFTDLVVTPVPNSIYDMQPRCQTSLLGQAPNEESTASNFSCARTLPYEPILSIPPEVFALDPAWHGCAGALNGVYDPPSVLVPQATLAVPTPVTSPTTTPAIPANSATPTIPTNTKAPQTTPWATSTKPIDTQPASPVVASLDPTTSLANDPASVTVASHEASVDPYQPTTAQEDPPSTTQDTTGDGDPASNEASSGIKTSPTAIPGNHADPQTITAPSSSSGNVASAIMAIFGAVTPSDPSNAESDPAAIGGSSAVATSAAATFTIGSQPFTAPSGSPLIMDSYTITAGGSAATISGKIVSVASDGVVVDDTTQSYGAAVADTTNPTQAASSQAIGFAAILTIGTQAMTVRPGAPATVGSLTITAGGPAATVSGQVVSVGSDGLVVGGSTHSFSSIETGGSDSSGAATSIGAGAIVTIGSQTYTAISISNGIIVGTQTLTVDGPAKTLGAGLVSAAPSGLLVSASGTSALLPVGAAMGASSVSGGAKEKTETIDVDSTIYTVVADPADPGELIVDGIATLAVAGTGAIIDGHSLSLASSGLAVDGSTTFLSILTPAGSGSASDMSSSKTTAESGDASTAAASVGTSTSDAAATSQQTTKHSAAALVAQMPDLIVVVGACLLAASLSIII